MPQITKEDIQAELEKRKSEEKSSNVRLDELIEKKYKQAHGIGARGRKGETSRLTSSPEMYKKEFGDLYYHGLKDDIESGRIRNIDALESFKQFRKFNPGVDPRPEKVQRWWKDFSREFIKSPSGTPEQEEAKKDILGVTKNEYLNALRQLGSMEPSQLEQATREALPGLIPDLMQEFQNPSALTTPLFADAQDFQRQLGPQLISQLLGPQSLQQNIPQILGYLGGQEGAQLPSGIGESLGALKDVGREGYGALQGLGQQLRSYFSR